MAFFSMVFPRSSFPLGRSPQNSIFFQSHFTITHTHKKRTTFTKFLPIHFCPKFSQISKWKDVHQISHYKLLYICILYLMFLHKPNLSYFNSFFLSLKKHPKKKKKKRGKHKRRKKVKKEKGNISNFLKLFQWFTQPNPPPKKKQKKTKKKRRRRVIF